MQSAPFLLVLTTIHPLDISASLIMVLFFTSAGEPSDFRLRYMSNSLLAVNPAAVVYMGRDKVESKLVPTSLGDLLVNSFCSNDVQMRT